MDAQAAVEQIQQPQDLTILALSAPILSSLRANASSPNKRSSNASSTDGQQNATPAALLADLNHYRDLFTKLRFSYTEQVTKERFLRSLTASPPEFVDASENAELQERLDGEKATLKQKKTEVRETIADIEEQSRHLARRKSISELIDDAVLTERARLRGDTTADRAARSLARPDRQPAIRNR